MAVEQVSAARAADPLRVPGALVEQFYRDCDFDPEAFKRVLRIEIRPAGIRVTWLRVDEQGRRLVSDGEPVVETVDVPIYWSKQADTDG